MEEERDDGSVESADYGKRLRFFQGEVDTRRSKVHKAFRSASPDENDASQVKDPDLIIQAKIDDEVKRQTVNFWNEKVKVAFPKIQAAAALARQEILDAIAKQKAGM